MLIRGLGDITHQKGTFPKSEHKDLKHQVISAKKHNQHEHMQCNKMLPWKKPPENDRKRCYVQYKMKGPDFHATCDNINHIISALIKSARPLARFSARWRNKNKCGTKTCTTSKHPFRLIALVFNRHTCPALRQTRRPRLRHIYLTQAVCQQAKAARGYRSKDWHSLQIFRLCLPQTQVLTFYIQSCFDICRQVPFLQLSLTNSSQILILCGWGGCNTVRDSPSQAWSMASNPEVNANCCSHLQRCFLPCMPGCLALDKRTLNYSASILLAGQEKHHLICPAF